MIAEVFFHEWFEALLEHKTNARIKHKEQKSATEALQTHSCHYRNHEMCYSLI